MTMIQDGRTLFLTSFATLLLVATIRGQDQRGGPGGQQGGSAAGSRGGHAFGVLPAPPPPKPLIPNAKPVRSSESLATVSLPNTTIESAAIDPNNSGICRVSAFTTHPPTGDKAKIWIGILTANWNSRFMGTGGGHCGGGSGPPPSAQQEALLAWVEEGKAPDTLTAARRDRSGSTQSRPLRRYPLVAKYKGTGSTDNAANFVCGKGF